MLNQLGKATLADPFQAPIRPLAPVSVSSPVPPIAAGGSPQSARLPRVSSYLENSLHATTGLGGKTLPVKGDDQQNTTSLYFKWCQNAKIVNPLF